MAAGRYEGFSEFVAARGAALARTAFLLTGDVHRAEDLLQTALAKAMVRWDRIDPDRADDYVRRALVNTQISWWRRRGNHEQPSESLPEAFAPDVTDSVGDRDRLLTALRALPARQRAVVVLRYYEDLPDDAIAALLGCSTATVRSQVSRGVAKLRVALAAPEPAETSH